MKQVEIEVISKETIKPSFPTPDHLHKYQLSFLDQLSPKTFMPWVLFYPKDGHGHANLSNVERRDAIKKSLSEALTVFKPLAGRVDQENLYVDCNDEGVHYVEAKAKCELSEILENPIPGELNKFLPYELDDVNELAAVQVTFFDCGGIAVSLLMSHKVGDASSFFLFLNSWAAIARGRSDLVTPKFNSAIHFPPASSNPDRIYVPVRNTNVVARRFVFGASAIAALRAKYSTDNTNIEYPRPTRVEALSAFIWSRFIASKEPAAESDSDPNKVYAAFHLVNLRTKMDPSLSDNDFGNIYQSAVSVLSNNKTNDGFNDIIAPVRDATRKVDMDYVKKLKENDGHSRFITKIAEKLGRGPLITLVFTSLSRFPVYEADFGWGKPVWVGSAKLTHNNLVTFIDTKSGDGIEAWVNLDEKEMAKLETDEELLAYVSLGKILHFRP